MIIYVGDDMVDLYPKANVFYTVQRVNIGNLTGRSVNYTNNFTAPWTENNERIFGFAKDEKTSSTEMYQLRQCKIVNGFEVARENVLYITKSNDRQFTLQIFENLFDYFISVNNKNIGDIEPIDPTPWRAADIDDARDTTEGIISAVIDWGVPIYSEQLFMPSFFYHTFIKAILEFTGLNIEGDILTDERFTDLVIPFPNDEFLYPESYFRQFNFYNPRGADENVVGSTGDKIVFGQNVSGYLHGTYFARVSVGGISWTGGNNLYLRLTKNGDIVASYLMATNPAPGITVEVEYTGFVDAGDIFNFIIFADAAGPGIDYTIVGSSTYMKFTPDGIVNRDMVNWNALLPQISCTDLLKDFFNRFGVIPKQTEDSIILKTFEEIIENVPGSIDWSSKLVNVKKKALDFKTDYAQDNRFNYVDKVNSPDLGAGSLLVDSNILPLRKTLYQSIFGNANTVQFFGWNLASVPVFDGAEQEFEGFSEGRSVNVADSIVQGDASTIVNLSGTFNFTIDVLTVDTTVMLRNIGAGVVTLVEGAGLDLPGGSFDIDPDFYVIIVYRVAAKPDIYLFPDEEVTVFADSPGLRLLTLKDRTDENEITFDATPRTDYRIGYFIDETLDKDTGFQYFIDQFYASLEASLQRNKIPTKYYNLKDIDIYNYDVHKMMYDGEGYYIVNKIAEYASGRITKVELFKVM